MAYMLIAMSLFSSYPSDTRLQWVKDYYDAISTFAVSLPTPVMAGVRTPQRQFSSCVLIETDDSLDSINATSSAIVKYVSQKAGIGIGAGKIRAIGSPIRKGDAYHTGVIPFYKLFQASVKSCSQGSVRGGAATLYYPIWHLEVEDLLVLKNNKGSEDNRVRHLDFGVQFCKLFYERLINNGNITLFSPSDVPGLYDAFFADQEKFRELYETAERNTRLRKKTIKAIDLFSAFMEERKNTGRIYLMNVDHANEHGSFKPDVMPIRMSNLCVAGDTKIDAVIDQVLFNDVRIDWVIEQQRTGHRCQVLSFNEVTGKKEFKTISAGAMTQQKAKVIKIQSEGKTLTLTPDHLVFTKNRGYVKASDLLETDELEFKLTQPNEKILIQAVDELIDVYDITVEDNANFFANDILIHNCAEIALPTKPLTSIDDDEGRIALCTLSAINWGIIKTPADFEKPCELAVRGLDALLDYQKYPVIAAELHSMEYRPLGIGIINLAYFLAKNDTSYSDPDLELIDEYAEAWSYYLIQASVKLAMEVGACDKVEDTKYSDGIVPMDTRKSDVDDLVPYQERMNWAQLRKDLKEYGIRNSTLMALMPSETSAQISNSTNGVEPPRAFVSVKQSKDGVLKQVVPGYPRLKNKYDLLWEQQSPVGYLKIMAVLQKFIDQSISVNTSYNPMNYEDEKIPMSDMLQHLLMCYKYGIKTLYYFNTFDGQGEIDLDKVTKTEPEMQSKEETIEDDCDSCKI